MTRTPEELLTENRRLRERVERLYSEALWMDRQLRRVGDSPDLVLVRPDMHDGGATAGAALPRMIPDLPPETVWPAGKPPAYPLRPPPGLANYAMERREAKTIGIGVCGLEPAAIERVVTMVEERQRSGGFCPVFLTDSSSTEIFRRRGYVFEFLPEVDATTETGQTYAAKRIALIEEKWDMAGIIGFGQSAYPMGSRAPGELNLAEDAVGDAPVADDDVRHGAHRDRRG